jgi:hypothetical protein
VKLGDGVNCHGGFEFRVLSKLKRLCKILLATAFVLPVISSSVLAEASAARTYSIKINDFLKDGESLQRLVIRSKNRTVLDQTAHNFAVVDPFSAIPNLGLDHARLLVNDLTGDGKQSLIIRTWSGGAHCCYSYDIYSVTDSLKKIWHFDAHDGHMLTARKNQKSLPTLYIEDATFRYWGVCVPIMPVVALEWNGRTFAPVHSKMIHKLDVQDNQKATMSFLKSLKPDQQQEFYGLIIKLYYSGNAEAAMRYLKEAKGESYDSEHTDLVRQLKTSPFYDDVRAINRDQPKQLNL